MDNPCITCGACCATFRASFHWSEADDAGGSVPVDLTVDISDFRRAMRGTERAKPCCVALEGVLGAAVRCGIYERRPSVCREFTPSWEDGVHNEKCDQARRAFGLAPLAPPLANSITSPTGESVPAAVDFLDSLPHNSPAPTRTRT